MLYYFVSINCSRIRFTLLLISLIMRNDYNNTHCIGQNALIVAFHCAGRINLKMCQLRALMDYTLKLLVRCVLY